MEEEKVLADTTQEDLPIENIDIIRVSRSNDQFHFFAHEDLTSAELIFFIKYLKNDILPAIISKEIS
jgi:hypothetical protein